jgi:hypothetical protein
MRAGYAALELWGKIEAIAGTFLTARNFTQLFSNLTDDYFRRESAFLAHT